MKKFFLPLAIAATVACVSCKKSTDTVVSAPNYAITGSKVLTVDSTIQLTDTIAGGSWISSDTTVATISSTGLISGVKSGTVIVTYNFMQNANAMAVFDTLVVNPTTDIFPIMGGNSVTSGSSIQLTENFTGGNWASSDSTIATVSPSGLVTGIESGNVTISYNINNLYANYTTTEMLTVQ